MRHLVVLRDPGSAWEPPDARVGDVTVTVAASCADASASVRQVGRADVLLLDVRMQTPDVLAEIAAHDELRDVPVVTVSLTLDGMQVLSGDAGLQMAPLLRTLRSV